MKSRSLLDSLEARYGRLWTCESVKRCKSSSNSQKLCQWFWKLTPARTCKPFWKFLRYRRLCCCCYIISSKFVRKLRSTIEYFFQTKVCGFFVAADMAFSDVSSVESSRNLHFPATLSARNFVCFPCKPVYELITGIEWSNQDVRNALSEVENLVITDTDDAYSRFIFQKSRICQLAYNSRLHKK